MEKEGSKGGVKGLSEIWIDRIEKIKLTLRPGCWEIPIIIVYLNFRRIRSFSVY